MFFSIRSIVCIFFIFFFASGSIAQVDLSEVMFVISNSGDSILTKKIILRETNEDQVTFLLDGKPKKFKANEIKSYFQKSRKYKIFIPSENEYKLARIIIRGPYKLAQSFTAKGDEKFYLQVDKEWINLDPHAYSLATFLPTVLPNFKEGVSSRKIYYDSSSLGKAISEYNQFKDSDYNVMGFPGYNKRMKLGFLATLGTSSLIWDELTGDPTNIDPATNINLGLYLKIINSRLFSMRFQVAYNASSWESSELTMKLRTINIAPLVSIEFLRPSRQFGLSFATGPVFLFDLNSEIKDLTINTNRNETFDLRGYNLGYDFQLAAGIGKKLELFTSYQFSPSIKSGSGGLLGSTIYNFKINTIKVGLIWYVK